MRRFKKFSFAMLAVCSLLCTSAYAASYAWNFTLDTGESTYSSAHAKADDEQDAYVRIDGGNLTEGADKVWFRVRRYSDDAAMTETKWADSKGIRFTLHYEKEGIPGVKYRLKMQQDSIGAGGATANGYWTP